MELGAVFGFKVSPTEPDGVCEVCDSADCEGDGDCGEMVSGKSDEGDEREEISSDVG